MHVIFGGEESGRSDKYQRMILIKSVREFAKRVEDLGPWQCGSNGHRS